jgi:hypothetical protein
MKRCFSLAIAMTMVAVLATAARSQAAGPQLMRAHIPFAFHAGSRELPAGEYSITVLNPSSDQKVLQIRSTDGRISAIVSTLSAKAKSSERSRLLFHRYGDTYFFAQAQVAGELTSLAAVKSSAERTEARIARNRSTTNVAILAE